MLIIGVDDHPSSRPDLRVHSGGNLFRLCEIFGRILWPNSTASARGRDQLSEDEATVSPRAVAP